MIKNSFALFGVIVFIGWICSLLTGCSSAPKAVERPCDNPEILGILKPDQRGEWKSGLYIVDFGEGKPPVLWCTNTAINWVPSDFEIVKRKAVAEGVKQWSNP